MHALLYISIIYFNAREVCEKIFTLEVAPIKSATPSDFLIELCAFVPVYSCIKDLNGISAFIASFIEWVYGKINTVTLFL